MECSANGKLNDKGRAVRGCVACGGQGRKVPRVTLESLLNAEATSRIGERPWSFCSEPGCDVVYFADGWKAVFVKSDLRVKVHPKEPGDPDVPVCYCYGHTPRSIAEELERTGRSTAGQAIKEEVAGGRCFCEVANPRGACCLGDVAKVVERWRQRRRREAEPRTQPALAEPVSMARDGGAGQEGENG